MSPQPVPGLSGAEADRTGPVAGAIKLLSVVGARPQFVKLAPIVRAAMVRAGVVHEVVHTGQHYDDSMSNSFFEQLQLPAPDVNLGVGSGSHARQTGAMMTALEEIFEDRQPDGVVVYGDTNSTLAATLAAAKIHIPVLHVEAGLRSFNRSMPEELNRLVADHCGDRLYAPTPQALANLERENLQGRAVFSGDVMRDAVLHNLELSRSSSRAVEKLGLAAGEFGLVTVHRPVNTTGESLEALMRSLERVADEQCPLVFPVHPRTRAVLSGSGYKPPERLRLLDPVPYLDILALIDACALVLTDSGGVQKEAAFLETACVTLREETEWTETVEIGINRLVGSDADKLREAVADLLGADSLFDDRVRGLVDANYGRGDAATKIIDDCQNWLSEQ